MKKLYELYEHQTMKIRIIKIDSGYQASIDFHDSNFDIPWLIENLSATKSKMAALVSAKTVIENYLSSIRMSDASEEEIFLYKHMVHRAKA